MNSLLQKFHSGQYEEELINHNFQTMFTEIRTSISRINENFSKVFLQNAAIVNDMFNLRKASLNRIEKKTFNSKENLSGTLTQL